MSNGPCEHLHIRHETKRYTYCKDCGKRLVKHRGDWVLDTAHNRENSEEGAEEKEA